MDKSMIAPIGLAAFLFVGIIVLAIITSSLGGDCGGKTATALSRDEKSKPATELAKIEPGSKHDKFFANGLGYMSDMTTKNIEDEYMKYMARSTGGGYYYMNPAQIAAEVDRIVDDRVTVGTEIQKKERPAFRTSQGYINAPVDDGMVKSVATKM